ncbi:heterokaryon incompatibility protein-domain-containing protein [Nemania sp. FL0031]|nr:heterokaryon incompatibility protein-domain-containing protein [Nemania sp. FL0031]
MMSSFSGSRIEPEGSDHDPKERFQSHSIYSSMGLGESHIRLLELLPGRHQDPIQCTLFPSERPASDPKQISQDQVPPNAAYEALSYVWASDEEDAVIFVNHVPFTISANLYHALDCVRLSDKTRVLWVDAICINQQDIQEKSEQVRMMDQIYSNADTVLIYLGPDADGSSLVMDYLTVDDSELLDDNGVLFTKASVERSRAENKVLQLYVEGQGEFLTNYFTSRGLEEKRVVEAAYAFFCRPWWTRMWVIQEAKLAKRDPVWYCGRRSTTMKRLRERLPVLNNFTLSKKQPAYVPIEEALAAYPRGRGKPYQDLMAWSRGVECILFVVDTEFADLYSKNLSLWLDRCTTRHSTDPRDRIFALVSLLDPSARSLLAPDYSLSAHQIFSLATAYILVEEGSTHVFQLYSFTREHHSRSLSLDFAAPFPEVVATEFFSEYESAYWYTGPLHLRMADGKLNLLGIDFDSIREASNIDEGSSNFQSLKTIRMRQRMLGKYERFLVRPRVTPPERILRALLLAPSYEHEGAINNDATAPQGLDEDYLKMLQTMAPSSNELPGAIHFSCEMLKSVAVHIGDFVDGARCEHLQQKHESSSRSYKSYLRTVVAAMDQGFISAAAFELPELKSFINRFNINDTEPIPNRMSDTTTMTADIVYSQLKAAAELCYSIVMTHVESVTCSRAADIDETGHQLATAYAKAKALLGGIMASCTCGGSEREAHRIELEARYHAVSQEELMFEHVVKFLRQRKEAEYFSFEELAVDRQSKALFVTEAYFVGISFQRDPGFEEGDKVVLMDGFRAPMVLREVDGGGKFRIMGTAYLAGLSDVDFESLISDDVLQVEEFEII